MSMQQGLGIIGGVVGSFFGYPQLGFVVGSLVGGLLTPAEKTEGPRVDDLKVMVSTLGTGIPRAYGTVRSGGNVVWSTDKIEMAEEQGGKGGAPESTTYRYFVHMSIALCKTPLDGSVVAIRKIWQDGKLIYDASVGMPVASAIASAENPHAALTLYQGGEDQLPDPVEEIYVGIGLVPAYRGIVRASMIAVECPNGRVPQFSFEIATQNTTAVDIRQLISVPSIDEGLTAAVIRKDGVWQYLWGYQGFGSPKRVSYSYGQFGFLENVGVLEAGNDGTSPGFPIAGGDDPQCVFVVGNSLYLINFQSGRTTLLHAHDSSPVPGSFRGRGAYDSSSGLYVVASYGLTAPDNEPWIFSTTGGYAACETLPGDGRGPVLAFFGDIVHAVTASGANAIYSRRTTLGKADAGMPDLVGVGVDFDAANSALYADENGVFLLAIKASRGRVYKLTVAGFQLLCDDVGSVPTSISRSVSNTFYCNDTLATIGPIFSVPYGYNMVRFNAVAVAPVKVSKIISDQCLLAGLDAGQFTVAGIPDTDTVQGYLIDNPASARNNIDPLLTAYAIYATEEDAQLKFKKLKDVTSQATISYDELACAEDGGEAGDPMPLTRAQEAELPATVSVSYIDPTFDYQRATEKAQRQITESQSDQIVELPIVTSSDHAASVAQMLMYDSWNDRNRRTLKVSRKYAFLSPGDGVTPEYPRGTFQMRRIVKATDTGALMELEVVDADSSIYTQTATGAADYPGQVVAPLEPPTRMLLLDAPIMRDEDNNASLYVAAEGLSSGWRGYTLWVGDDDTHLQTRGSSTVTVPIGFAEGVLGGWTPNMMDERNTVIVNMGDDELNSTTRDLLYTSRVNLALIGINGRWEAIQFMTASSLGSGRFLLSSLMRGLFGTEQNANSHIVGDQFILITPAGMLRPSMDVGSIGQTRSYRGVSLGRSLSSTSSQMYANTAEGLSPYSPWDLRKSKAASNDQTLTWQRRTRLSSNSLRGAVPLGEGVESYSLDFYTSSAFTTLAGTLTSTSRSLIVTSAQQTAMGLTAGATLFVRVYQLSEAVGRGAALEATV